MHIYRSNVDFLWMRNTAKYSQFWKNTTEKENWTQFPEHLDFWINLIQNMMAYSDISSKSAQVLAR